MGWKKWIPKELKKPFKAIGKVSKKILPKELRPWLPMATAFLPYTGIMGAMGGPLGFAKMYGTNLLTQQLADPDAEFDELNQLSALLSGTQGGLMGTDTAQNLRDMTTRGKFDMSPYVGSPSGSAAGSDALAKTLADRSMLTKAKDLGLSGLAEASDYLTGTAKTLQDYGSGAKNLFSVEGAKEFAKDAAIPFAKGMGDVTEAYQRPVIRDWEAADAAERAEYKTNMDERNKEQAEMTMLFMRQAGHDEDTIQETLELDGLESYYSPPTEAAAQGGIIGLKHGGMLNFGGREMDLRGGGFVPIGRKERADDVPARLSKNEFVMTADAVRGAGGGDINKGAQRMYNVMNNLEARA